MLWDAPPRVFDPFAYPFAGEITHAAIGAARDSAGRPDRAWSCGIEAFGAPYDTCKYLKSQEEKCESGDLNPKRRLK